ncbi:MAG: bifunctional DNA-formamidopyrimidine glycosylase/DNA-(apurinic or apyrimidinic site) lyase [Pseudomonadales bacterium]|uniref:Formamidopyrimidine-DNA glycosylase n=1 Tax=Oleiphilus messinensis TaxID=141451 RepID=A0A1Y0I4J4_9GAMM|nr:bifunctional DNA-formamidopyrimidine glycosylase/DNA-(apurinic or apyrimidinic site) lyase [Oleiphilus messinensis]ARU54445.1 formamidopyrimidine-DNA glycosylase [Oleiphilus messinensis]MCG8613889.1 bifunctional DNA-formamidopyrimidine glycosylase/DNA-(apurinic or apyrimidinic site) lyase [Pseudomonadales bacterium]
MPELPEVETTKRGIAPHILSKSVTDVCIRQPKLRWPIPDDLAERLNQARLLNIHRRAKYLLLQFDPGWLLIHLGMSGSLRIVDPNQLPEKHDHVDIHFANTVLRFRDPRRFGAVLWLGDTPEDSPLLSKLGPEPLAEAFNGDYLYARSRGKTATVKQFIMDQAVVTGIGNIYATEALFLSGIKPTRAAGQISRERYQKLSQNAKSILEKAIDQGGTTLKDFVGSDGKPGYFKQELLAYGRKGLPCVTCETELTEVRLGNRSTVYCKRCQR